MKAVFRSDGRQLIPTDQDGADFCAKHRDKEVMVESRTARNPAQHRKFFALIRFLWEKTSCGENYPSQHALRGALIMAAGYTEIIPTRKGDVEVPKSIDFSMDQDEFNKLYEDCIQVVMEKILPGIEEEVVRQELLEFGA